MCATLAASSAVAGGLLLGGGGGSGSCLGKIADALAMVFDESRPPEDYRVCVEEVAERGGGGGGGGGNGGGNGGGGGGGDAAAPRPRSLGCASRSQFTYDLGEGCS